MVELVQGIHDFRPEDFRSSQRLFELPGRTGKPEALLIACSDLGIDPHSLIPTNLQDLYVLQHIANIVPPHDPLRPSALEQALDLYPLKDIVVCGHSPCDAMKRFLNDEEVTEMPSVAAWLGHAAWTKAIVEEHYSRLAGEALLAAAAAENVLVQLENLRTIPAVALKLERGDLHLHGWSYRDGTIFSYAPQRGAFVPLAQ